MSIACILVHRLLPPDPTRPPARPCAHTHPHGSSSGYSLALPVRLRSDPEPRYSSPESTSTFGIAFLSLWPPWGQELQKLTMVNNEKDELLTMMQQTQSENSDRVTEVTTLRHRHATPNATPNATPMRRDHSTAQALPPTTTSDGGQSHAGMGPVGLLSGAG